MINFTKKNGESSSAEDKQPTMEPKVPDTRRALRAAGDTANRGKAWAEAAHYYSRLLTHEPENAGLWLLHGHMQKEAGLLSSAARSYEKALSISPNDPEIFLQLGILAKTVGDFEKASKDFEKAKDLAHPNKTFIENELNFLQNGFRGKKRTWVPITKKKETSIIIYLSSKTTIFNNEHENELTNLLGSNNYSYAYIAKGYIEALKALEIPYELVTSPEFIPNIKQQSSVETKVHLGFYPPDSPRLLKGSYNIMVVAWEFERLKLPYEDPSHHAFADPRQMLNLADEVWSISSFGADALRNSSIAKVNAVPTPILSGLTNTGRGSVPDSTSLYENVSKLSRISWRPLAILPNMQSTISEEARRRQSALLPLLMREQEESTPIFFLTVLNVYDFRKQLRPVIEAFLRFSKMHSNAYLLLKVTFLHRGMYDVNEILASNQIDDWSSLTPPMVSDRILITEDVLTREEMNVLYDVSSFYISSSHCEGQNLPLLEAMGRGVVPVSVDHTAMKDYITNDNSIVIPSVSKPFSIRLSRRYGLYDINTYYVSTIDVLNSLVVAYSLDNSTYSTLSNNAHSIVKSNFGLEPFKNSLAKTILALKERIN